MYQDCYVFMYSQGAHVSINARTEDDVDEKLVIGKVAKASGANYSYHKEQKRPMPAAEPVVCVVFYYLYHFWQGGCFLRSLFVFPVC